MMDSLEERMLASMKRQQDEELALHQKKVTESSGLPVDPPLLANPLYDDSLTTNSDDDTTFNSLKVPVSLPIPFCFSTQVIGGCLFHLFFPVVINCIDSN